MGELPLSPGVPTVLGAVLAAGRGSRMGRPKAGLDVGGRSLLDAALAGLLDGGCDDVVAVLPAVWPTPEPSPAGSAAPVRYVRNPAAGAGMRSSARCALAAAADHDGLLVVLVDQPGIGAAATAAVLARWRAAPDRIATARYRGATGHPVAMSLARWTVALDLAGPDEGARRYLAAHTDDVDPVDAPGDPTDLDTPADLAAYLSHGD